MDVDFGGLLEMLGKAAGDKNYLLVVMVVTMLLVTLLRKVGGALPGRVGQFVKSRRGGWGLVLLSGIGVTLLAAVTAGKAITLPLVLSGLSAGFVAAGGFQAFKDAFLADKLKELQTEAAEAGKNAAASGDTGKLDQ